VVLFSAVCVSVCLTTLSFSVLTRLTYSYREHMHIHLVEVFVCVCVYPHENLKAIADTCCLLGS